MSRTVREVEVTGHVRQRVADRVAAVGGDRSVVFEMTPDQARQLAAELVEAADSWTEPMDVTS